MSDEDSQLALSCVERGWRYSRLDEDAFLFEERSEYLARVDERIVRILPRTAAVMGSTSAESGSLSAVLAGLARQSLDAELPGIGAGADVDASSTSVVSLSLLGARIDVRCAHPACAAGIAAFYSASTVPGASSSPEVVIWCDWEDSGRYLFRARPEDHAGAPLEGVFIQTLRSAQVPWTVDTPADPSAGVLAVQGPFRRAARGNGLHRCGRGRPHRGRPRVRQVDDGAAGIGAARRARVQTPITEVCTRIAREAVPVNRMLFLKPGAPASRISRQSRSDALRELLAHHREAGSSIGDARQTLLHLASRTESWSIEFPEHHALVDLVCDFIDA